MIEIKDDKLAYSTILHTANRNANAHRPNILVYIGVNA